MKKSYKYLSVAVLAAALVTGGIFATKGSASQSAEELATATANGYVTAFEEGNVDKLLEYVNDFRFNDAQTQKQRYNEYLKEEKKHKTTLKFLSLEKVDEDSFNAHFEIESDYYTATPLTLPVVQDENGEWNLVIDNTTSFGNRGVK